MADNETPADDLRSIMSQAYDESVKATPDPVIETKSTLEPKTEEVTTDNVEAKGETRERGPDGKFVKKTKAEEDADAAAAKAPKEEPETKVAKKDGDDKTVDDKTASAKTDGKEAPANWSASDKAMFKLQPPESQEFLLRRYKEMEAGFTKKTEALASLQKEFGPIDEMFKPHLETLKAKGLTPAATIKAWANVETALANGRGVDIVKGMIDSYRIDKAAVARALGFTSGTAAQPSTETPSAGATDQTTAQPGDVASMLAQLEAKLAKQFEPKLSRIDQWEAQQRTQQQSVAQERAAKVETDITNFKSAANEKGELLHPYFDEVEPAMIALAQGYVASKQPLPPLSDLYEHAVWANPSTRTAMQATQKAAEEHKRAEEARAKAASARRAGSSVTGSPGSGQATRQVRGELSLREQLEEAAAEAS